MNASSVGPLAQHLRRLREASGFSQEELAERAGLSAHAISALERGTRTRPYPHTLRALCEALELSEAERVTLLGAVRPRAKANQHAADSSTLARGLPDPTTRLLGRDDDIVRAAELLGAHRLVTLTGLGGVGKTRLALAVAAGRRTGFVGQVAYVELAPLRDVDEVLPAILDAVDPSITPGHDLMGTLVNRLRGQDSLLVLDNVEHLLPVAPSIAALMEAVPELTVLATSRAPLRVRGEVEMVVEPLRLPVDEEDWHSPAVRLLLERAGDVRPDWGIANHDRPAVAALCARLAGIPLALELAAARARLLDPEALLDRLDEATMTGPRDLPERQRTMRSMLDWSYGLLTLKEQALLRVLSVFVGGFRLEDVEEVVNRTGCLGGDEVLSSLESLVEQSLVVSDRPTPGARRQRLLEPVAQYAHDRLKEVGAWDTTVSAHAAHFLALAERVAPRYRDGGQVDALARVDPEHSNLTAAVERSLAAGEATTAARLTWALWMYWWLRGHVLHGRRLCEAVLLHELPEMVRGRAELAAATMTFALDDIGAARRWWEAASSHAGDDPTILANGIAGEGLIALTEGELGVATELFSRARQLAEEGGAEAEWTRSLCLIWLGTVHLLCKDFDGAVLHIEQGLASARQRGDRLSAYIALYNLSQVELSRGDTVRARTHLSEGLRLSRETGDLANLAYLLDAIAVLEATEGTHSRVPLLLGAAQGIRETIGTRGYGYYQPDPAATEEAAAQARRHLGTDRYDDALDLGRGMPVEQASLIALGERALSS